MTFACIAAEKARFPVTTLCAVFGVSRSGFYAWRRRDSSRRDAENRRLLVHLRALHRESRGTYGSPRLHRGLRASGERIGRNRVIRLMRAQHLRGRPRRRFRVTTDSRHTEMMAPNHLRRRFAIARPNTVWAADITAISTTEGWLYLAVVLDLCSRRLLGWATSPRIDVTLTRLALQRALDHRCRGPVIHHSDRGLQYASAAYQHLLARHHIVASMSRAGDCWDNAPVESFFSTLKRELIHSRPWPTRAAVITALTDYIDAFYNPRRLHSSLDYRSPIEFETDVA